MNTLSHPTKSPSTFRTSRGRSAPLGATPLTEGVNFVLMCRHGSTVDLVLQSMDSDDLLADIPLDPHKNRTGDLWHIQVYDLPAELSKEVAGRVDGPSDGGHRFGPHA